MVTEEWVGFILSLVLFTYAWKLLWFFFDFFLQDVLVLDVLEWSSLLQVLVGDSVTRITTLPLVPVPTVFVEQGFFSAMCKRAVRLTHKTFQRATWCLASHDHRTTHDTSRSTPRLLSKSTLCAKVPPCLRKYHITCDSNTRHVNVSLNLWKYVTAHERATLHTTRHLIVWDYTATLHLKVPRTI